MNRLRVFTLFLGMLGCSDGPSLERARLDVAPERTHASLLFQARHSGRYILIEGYVPGRRDLDAVILSESLYERFSDRGSSVELYIKRAESVPGLAGECVEPSLVFPTPYGNQRICRQQGHDVVIRSFNFDGEMFECIAISDVDDEAWGLCAGMRARVEPSVVRDEVIFSEDVEYKSVGYAISIRIPRYYVDRPPHKIEYQNGRRQIHHHQLDGFLFRRFLEEPAFSLTLLDALIPKNEACNEYGRLVSMESDTNGTSFVCEAARDSERFFLYQVRRDSVAFTCSVHLPTKTLPPDAVGRVCTSMRVRPLENP